VPGSFFVRSTRALRRRVNNFYALRACADGVGLITTSPWRDRRSNAASRFSSSPWLRPLCGRSPRCLKWLEWC